MTEFELMRALIANHTYSFWSILQEQFHTHNWTTFYTWVGVMICIFVA